MSRIINIKSKLSSSNVTKGVIRSVNAELEGQTPDFSVATYYTMSWQTVRFGFISLIFLTPLFNISASKLNEQISTFTVTWLYYVKQTFGPPHINSPNVTYITTVASIIYNYGVAPRCSSSIYLHCPPVYNALLADTQTQCPDTYRNYCTYYRTEHHGCTYFLNNIA